MSPKLAVDDVYSTTSQWTMNRNDDTNDTNKISQSIEPDCEHLQCFMSIYSLQNVSALADKLFLVRLDIVKY